MDRSIGSNHRVRRLALILLFSIALAGSLRQVALAKDPAAVGLTSFEATPLDNAVRLTWHTETEIDTVAFTVRRSDAGSTNFLWLDGLGSQGYVISEGGPSLGWDYEVTDDTVSNGIAYTYKLFEVESDLDEVELATLTVTAGVPTPTATATPVVLAGAHAVSTPTATPARAQSDETPTATRTSGPRVTGGDLSSATATSTTTIVRPTLTPVTADSEQSTGRPTVTFQDAVVNEGETGASNGDTSDGGSVGDGVLEVAAAAAQTEPDFELTPGYPGPTATATPSSDVPYPAQVAPTDTPQELIPYPLDNSEERVATVSVIGSQSQNQQLAPTEADATGGAVVGRLYLWVSFVVALLIFAAGVVGSILLFTRKRE